jgi:LEA14-like dessication related protein
VGAILSVELIQKRHTQPFCEAQKSGALDIEHQILKSFKTASKTKIWNVSRTKQIFIAAGILGAGYLAYKAAQKGIESITVEVVGIGKPAVNNQLFMTVPIELEFDNPTFIPIRVDRIHADIYLNKNGEWVKGATATQPVSISTGKSRQMIYPVLDLNSIFGGNIINTTQAVVNLIQTKTLQMRADVRITWLGFTLPMQSLPPQTVSLTA